MFGSKLKTWMENHIGRPRKKEKDKRSQSGSRGLVLESSESLAQSDTGISSGSQQVLSSSTTDNKEGYCTTTMESDRSGMTHCHTAVNLSSPESAYSTGYSTDGASPGGTGPPEYYINIRTGKHYFPSPAPTPTSPPPSTAFCQLHAGSQMTGTSFLTNGAPLSTCFLRDIPVTPPFKDELLTSSTRLSNGFPPTFTGFPEAAGKQSGFSGLPPSNFNFVKSPARKLPPKSPLNSLKLFLKSPKQDKGGKPKQEANKTPVFENKKKVPSPSKNRKWYKQPFQKFGHRRTDSSEDGNIRNDVRKDVYFDRSAFYLTKDSAASPRQRNRIKTNPWLPTEPMSSQNFQNLQVTFSPSLVRNRSCTNTPLQNRKTKEVETLPNRVKDTRECVNNSERLFPRQKHNAEASDQSEEDATLNEMMGTYNESYVYEKETDILSDSDPTDCEDYVSDSEADNGGDEQDSHDDELDFIDNGTVPETEDDLAGNTGKCTYHEVCVKRNSFLYKSDRHHSRKEAELRKSFRKEYSNRKRSKEDKKRRASAVPAVTTTRKTKREEDEMRKRCEVKRENPLSLSRVLMERMMTMKRESKSAEGTPVRRHAFGKELRETHIGKSKAEATRIDRDILLADAESDRKYDQLIKEAENMIETMKNSPVIQNRKWAKREEDRKLKDIWKKEESSFPEPESFARKSPKHLGLNLTSEDTPKKVKHLDLLKDGKSSFKAKSSAHSPLDPLGPTFRNFTIFKPVRIDERKTTSTSSEEEPIDRLEQPDAGKSLVPVPIAFQSVDLGKPLTTYCPQSEPVKRKIYSCSKTYDKLVKQFETKPKIFEEGRSEVGGSPTRRKRREAPERATFGGSDKEHGNQGSGRRRETSGRGRRDKEVLEPFTGSPRSSPRRSSMPGVSAGPDLSRRCSFDLDSFR